jgi:tRNA pseudouridine55 synthase
MEGILLVDKPKGWTSFDAVNYVRKIVAQAESKKPKNVKVGHTGTLDPLATGLLVLLIGKTYTRRAGEFSKLDKSYQVEMKLGETSATGDDEGQKTAVSAKKPSKSALERALATFLGDIQQTPPIYSAIKINGKRAYKLAREGQEITLEPRPITIHHLELTSYKYPSVQFTADVSSGTYIRSLVEDIGKNLTVGAYMSNLRRMSVGQSNVDNSASVKEIQSGNLHLLGASDILP